MGRIAFAAAAAIPFSARRSTSQPGSRTMISRANGLALSLLLGAAATAGSFAVIATAEIGAAETKPEVISSRQIAQRSRKLDSWEASLRQALKARPPALPALNRYAAVTFVAVPGAVCPPLAGSCSEAVSRQRGRRRRNGPRALRHGLRPRRQSLSSRGRSESNTPETEPRVVTPAPVAAAPKPEPVPTPTPAPAPVVVAATPTPTPPPAASASTPPTTLSVEQQCRQLLRAAENKSEQVKQEAERQCEALKQAAEREKRG